MKIKREKQESGKGEKKQKESIRRNLMKRENLRITCPEKKTTIITRDIRKCFAKLTERVTYRKSSK